MNGLDHVDWQILEALQSDARMPFSELGRRVGLSSPAVTERVRRMEDSGVIKGYRADVDLAAVGLTMEAIIQLRLYTPRYSKGNIDNCIQGIAEVMECSHITGEDCYFIRVAVASIAHLEQLVYQFSEYGHTTTSMILSSPVPANSRPVLPVHPMG